VLETVCIPLLSSPLLSSPLFLSPVLTSGRDRLIPWLLHLVLGRQVHPELAELEGAAFLGESLAVELLVDDALRRRHPLDVAGADDAGVTLMREWEAERLR